jgi:(heptosyl)LPS beta-1,4-glucosyltransferase
MVPVSVVIITRNEAAILGRTLQPLQFFTDDVIVVDSGSTDGTQYIVRSYNFSLIETTWDGFGPSKNKGIDAAKYDWILSIDADEIPDKALVAALHSINFEEFNAVYNIQFKTYYCNQLIRFGEWGTDAHIRLFNRRIVRWSNTKVHETLQFPIGVEVKPLNGFLHHYTVNSYADHLEKTRRYAKLNAEKYQQQGKKANWLKAVASASFNFLKNYVFKMGFLDGKAGWQIAKLNALYSYLKYAPTQKQ